MTQKIACHVVISGRVQGVWYRAWSEREAAKLALTGWVRNRSDATVEAVFCGSAADVAEMIERCRQGPPLARVDAIKTCSCEIPAQSGFFKRATL